MGQLLVSLALLACVPAVWWQMLRGWRRRVATQEGTGPGALALPAPAPVDAGDLQAALAAAAPVPGGVEGVYVSTTLAGQPFERVAAHGLGTRSSVLAGVVGPGVVGVGAGGGAGGAGALLLERPGARSLRLEAGQLVSVGRSRGQAGKFTVGREGLVVVTWRLGQVEVDTALRTRRRQDAGALVAAVQALLPQHGSGPGSASGSAA